ncbi:MAG: BatA domain-containing protein, partial [Thermoanaerobaculia bacterium]
MQALHLWALVLGGLAAALPVAIHLLTRARGRRLVYPTFRFVLEALRARRRWSRLRDLLVLALRTAAVLALASMFARLVTRAPETSAALEG